MVENKITRKAFARLAAAAPLVAIALKSDGSRPARADSFYCRNANSICAKGCKTLNCKNACTFAPFCEECVKCRPAPEPTPDPSYCTQVNSACAGGCTINCKNSCVFALGTCSGCAVCTE